MVGVGGLGALTEPMWSDDFLAIWGLTIYALSAVPERLHTDPALAFSHPEYPLGIPFQPEPGTTMPQRCSSR